MPASATLKPTLRPALQKRGTAAWCVNIPPHLSSTGKRQQLFFTSKTEASAACEKLKGRKDNFGISLSALTPARIAEAAEAYQLLREAGVESLISVVRQHIAWRKEQSATIPFGELFEKFLVVKAARSPKYIEQLQWAKNQLVSIHGVLACDLTARQLEEVLQGFRPAVRNAFHRYSRAVLNFGVKRDYLATNPAVKLDRMEVPKKEVEIFNPKMVQKLLNHALENDLEFLPYRILGFFCGIRPSGELERLEWEDIRLDNKVVVLRAEVTKTKRKRFVDLSQNAVEWINEYIRRGGKTKSLIAPFTRNVLGQKHRNNYKGINLKKWIQQGMRHSFCSYWLAKHGDINKLVIQSGHTSVDTMWRHYHQGTTKAEAEKFWSITPPSTASNIVRITA